VTGASTVDLAIVLIDARKGILPQTRRHMTLAHLMGLRHVVVAINKMDLVGWDEAVYRAIQRDVEAFALRLGQTGLRFLPMSALKGDMVVDRGGHLSWYEGPALLELLETVDLDEDRRSGPFRFPVQLVCRPRTEAQRDFRGYMGRVESGRVAVGDPVTVLPGGVGTRVAAIEHFGRQLPEAVAGQSVTLLLADEVDISRGDLLAGRAGAPTPTREVVATLCWLSERPLDAGSRLLLQHGTRTVRARVHQILGRLDLQSQSHLPAQELQMNDIATVSLRLQQDIAPDPYARVRSGGAFILVDEAGNATVAAGLVLEPEVF
jgi:sulfate adenylyltransferase subunit 1